MIERNGTQMGSRTKVTEDMIIEINELYLQHGTYAAVGRLMNLAPTTIKRYVRPDYVSTNNIMRQVCDIEAMRRRIESFVLSKAEMQDPLLLTLSAGEKAEIEELQKELLI